MKFGDRIHYHHTNGTVLQIFEDGSILFAEDFGGVHWIEKENLWLVSAERVEDEV